MSEGNELPLQQYGEHYMYLPAAVDHYCCGECNKRTMGYVEWPCEPAQLRAEVDRLRATPGRMPGRPLFRVTADASVTATKMPGWSITIWIDAEAPADEVDRFFDAVADAVHDFEPRTGWDPHMLASRVTS